MNVHFLKPHISINAPSIGEGIVFYKKLFGIEPQDKNASTRGTSATETATQIVASCCTPSVDAGR